ncbi:hypothetical protein PR048_030962 [Dryococelus australis]|uniref:Uncharacterized protein n=1 Tax=Dryococelus australis TaxID=614101 RepID=A0ABQ9GE94_9NEOP|nr:hypothetical protein PR048_030962 [Dryococelus australis]
MLWLLYPLPPAGGGEITSQVDQCGRNEYLRLPPGTSSCSNVCPDNTRHMPEEDCPSIAHESSPYNTYLAITLSWLDYSSLHRCENHAGRCRCPGCFLGDLPFPPPLHSGAAPYSPRCTLIGSEDLNVKSPPPHALPTLLEVVCQSVEAVRISHTPSPVRNDADFFCKFDLRRFQTNAEFLRKFPHNINSTTTFNSAHVYRFNSRQWFLISSTRKLNPFMPAVDNRQHVAQPILLVAYNQSPRLNIELQHVSTLNCKQSLNIELQHVSTLNCNTAYTSSENGSV